MAGLTVHVADPDPGADHTAAVPEEDLMRLLDAILSNATKYAGSGADVDIDCRAGDNHVVVSITDTGPGVSAAELPMIADRFFRASSAHGTGTGLGLAIVAALIERGSYPPAGPTIAVRSPSLPDHPRPDRSGRFSGDPVGPTRPPRRCGPSSPRFGSRRR